LSRSGSFVKRHESSKRTVDHESDTPGVPVVVGDYFTHWSSKVIPACNLKGTGWKPPFGFKGNNGKFKFNMRFKSNQGKVSIRGPSRGVVVAGLLDFVPRQWTEDNGHPGEWRVAMGNWQTNAITFYSSYNRNFRDNRLKLDLDETLISNIIKDLNFPYIPVIPSRDEIWDISFTADSSSGVVANKIMSRFKECFTPVSKKKGYQKGSFIGCAAQSVFDSWDIIHSGKLNNTSGLFSVGAREKHFKYRFKEYVVCRSKIFKSRPVFVPDVFNVVFNSVYFKFFKLFWNDREKDKSCIFLDHSMGSYGWSKLNAYEITHRYEMEWDWKLFDISVPTVLIKQAFNIIRSCFPKSDSVDNAFIFMMNQFCHKDLVTPDGNVYRINGSIPSGDIWTSLIGSVVNYLALEYCFKKSKAFQKWLCNNRQWSRKYFILGDDGKLAYNTKLPTFVVEDIIDTAKSNLGMTLEIIVYNSTPNCNNINSLSGFLKTIVHNGLPHRKDGDLWEKLLIGPALKSIVKGDYEYAFARISNIFLQPGVERDKVCRFLGFICWYERLNDEHRDKIYEWALKINGRNWDFSGLDHLTHKASGANSDALKRWIHLFHMMLGSWYDKILFSWKPSTYKPYWLADKTRVSIKKWLSNPTYSFKNMSGFYYDCLFYGFHGIGPREPPMVV